MVYQDLDQMLHYLDDPVFYCTLSFNLSQMSHMLLEHSTLAPNKVLCSSNSDLSFLTITAYSIPLLLCQKDFPHLLSSQLGPSCKYYEEKWHPTALPCLALHSHLVCPVVPKAYICCSIL